MSVANHEQDEPTVCEEHERNLPCRECLIDVEDERADWIVAER